MNPACNQFLARPAFTQHEYGCVASCHLFNRATYLQNLRIPGNQSRQDIRLLHALQALVLLLKFIETVGAFYCQSQQIDFKRFCEKIIGTQADSTQRVGPVILACQDDNLGLGSDRQDLLE